MRKIATEKIQYQERTKQQRDYTIKSIQRMHRSQNMRFNGSMKGLFLLCSKFKNNIIKNNKSKFKFMRINFIVRLLKNYGHMD